MGSSECSLLNYWRGWRHLEFRMRYGVTEQGIFSSYQQTH